MSAVPERLQWRYAPLDAEVACTSTVLETIRRETIEGLNRLSRGGLETGGILLGRRTDRSMEIVGALPVECEHKLGPLFILSAADEKALDSALTSDRLGSFQPVGLYVSHARRGFSVAETDAKILDRLSPGPWQLVLIVMPARLGPCRAGFFIRGSVERAFVCAHEVALSPHERLSEPVAATLASPAPIAPTPLAAVVRVSPLLRKVMVPTRAPVITLRRFYSLLTHEYGRLRFRDWSLTASLALLFLCVVLGGLWLRARTVSSPTVPLHVSDLGRNLRVEWDPAQKQVRTASAATLEIHDGGRSPIMIPITRSGLNNGSLVYVPQSGNVEVRLKLMRGSKITSESVIYFINPSRVTAALAPALITAPAITTAPAAIVRAPLPAPIPAAEAAPPRIRAADREKPAPKLFQMPESRPPAPIAQPANINMPDLPDFRIAQVSAPTLPVANGPSLTALLVSPAHMAGPPQLRSGRLIWTGSLRKNGSLTITPSGASSGVLSGHLPGVPVNVSLLPAELVDGGIAVYSKDAERSGASEPPSAWNGWNVTVLHDWDPKRIAEVNIAEFPGPSNNWKRLVVRGGNRNVSVFVVNWQR